MKVFMVTLVALSLIVLVSPALATEDRFDCRVKVFPQNPTSTDDVDVSVGFLLRTSPPSVTEFSPVALNGNAFSITATLMVPRPEEAVLQIIHLDNNTYHLGKLEPGNYSFMVYAKAQGSSQTWLEKKVDFMVTSSERTAPEYSSIAGLLLLIMASATAVCFARRRIARART